MEAINVPTIDLGQPKQAGSNQPLKTVIEEVKIEKVVPQSSIPSGELLKTLYFLFDTFKPFGIQFFPVRQTAEDMIAGRELSGDQIDIGIRKNEWNDTSKFYIYHNFDNEHVETISRNVEQEEYLKDGVKIVFHLYSDNDCIAYLSSIQYEFESWDIPQRFEEFCEKYDQNG